MNNSTMTKFGRLLLLAPDAFPNRDYTPTVEELEYQLSLCDGPDFEPRPLCFPPESCSRAMETHLIQVRVLERKHDTTETPARVFGLAREAEIAEGIMSGELVVITGFPEEKLDAMGIPSVTIELDDDLLVDVTPVSRRDGGDIHASDAMEHTMLLRRQLRRTGS